MEFVKQLGDLTFTLSINAEKQRAVVTGIVGGSRPGLIALLDRTVPDLIGCVSALEGRKGLHVGKLYMMVPEEFAGVLERHGLRQEARYPAIFEPQGGQGSRQDGLDYAWILDEARAIGDHDRAEIARMAEEVCLQPPRRHQLPGYTIRKGRVEDAAAIAALLTEVFHYNDDFPRGITAQIIAACFEDDAYLCYVCQRGGSIVGYLSAYGNRPQPVLGFQARELILETAAVARSERKNGIMTEMIRQVRAIAEAEGKTWYSYCRVLMPGGRALATGMHRSMQEAGAAFLGTLSYAYTIVTDEDPGQQPRFAHAAVWGAGPESS